MDAERVRAANELYKFTARAVTKLDALGISWSVENPTNSLMWQTSWFQEIRRLKESQDEFTYQRITFDMCMHGGQRAKHTDMIFGGGIGLSPLAKMCDGSHQHSPWGHTQEKGTHFATAAERNYPDLLCRRMALQAAKAHRVKGPNKNEASDDKIHHTEQQPRRTHNEVVSEYKTVETFRGVAQDEIKALRAWTEAGRPEQRWKSMKN